MTPRPTWFWFICTYLYWCLIPVVIIILIAGVPLVAIAAYVWHK